MFDFAAMSPAEIQFIRLYVLALRRDYYLVRSVMDLMHPNNLGVRGFAEATSMALALEEMHGDFDKKITKLQKKHDFRRVKTLPGPSVGELADLFSLSFFKLVNVEEDAKSGKSVKTDEGWFSGKPTEWKKTLSEYKQVLKNASPSLPDLLSNFFNAALKFFPFDLNHKKWQDGFPGHTKKMWPPGNKYEDEDAQYFDDDDDDTPFDMFFNDDD